jgi:hypothetical protein
MVHQLSERQRNMPEKKRIKVSGKELVEKIKQLVSRGDVRRVCLQDEEGSLMELPLETGDPASPATMLKAPVLAAINAFSTLVNECTIEVEKVDPQKKS